MLRGAVVVCDRYIDSSVAYQGLAAIWELNKSRELSAWATENLFPDLTVVLDVDPAIGLARGGPVSGALTGWNLRICRFTKWLRKQAFLRRCLGCRSLPRA